MPTVERLVKIGVSVRCPAGLLDLVPRGGVVARIEMRQQLRHLAQALIAKGSGIPSSVIRFKILQAITTSTSCDWGWRARILPPMIDLYL